ncbi:MAG: nucleotide pyrophosphohydrolase [Planctomycetota bacterium]|nr:nucleotide pyrophosphohydrolase [Planctomycetota bacterium]
MNDSDTTIGVLRDLVRRFVDERNWSQFHAPKNLSMALAVEAAELMEHFQWITPEESHLVRNHAEKNLAVCDELADVICYALAIANVLQIDIATAVEQKVRKNAEKYPVDQFRGRYGPEDPAPVE